MRKLVQKFMYRKWFYGFLAAVLWLDSWTDLADLVGEKFRLRELISLILSVTAALLLTLIFIDLHSRRPVR